MKSVLPGWVAMKPNTAVGLLISGLGLILLTQLHQRFAHRLLFGGGLVLLFIGGLTLSEYSMGWDLRLDQLLFSDQFEAPDTSHPGRMAPSTALCLILIGASFLAGSLPVPSGLSFPFVQGLGAAIALLGLLSFLGYGIEAVFGYRGWNYTGMAIHTALGFFLVGSGLLAWPHHQQSWTWMLDFPTTVGFTIGLGLMLVVINLGHHFANKLVQTSGFVAHRQEVLREIQEVTTIMTNVMSGVRNYILTGQPLYLESRASFKATLAQKVANLRQLVSDNPRQQQNLDQFQNMLDEKIAWEERTLEAYQTQGFPAAQKLISTSLSLTLREKLNRQIEIMQKEEYDLLAQNRFEANQVATATFLVLPMSAFLTLTLLLLGLSFLNKGMGDRQRAEQAVREREKQLSLIADNLPGLVSHMDLNLRYLFINSAYERWLGKKEEALLGHTMREVIGEEAFQRAQPMTVRALAGEQVSFENHMNTVTGANVYLWVTFIPDFSPTGEVKGLFTVAMDITERKAAGAKAQWLASFPEQNPNPITELDVVGGQIRYTNPTASQLFPDLTAQKYHHPWLAGLPEDAQNLIDGKTKIIRREIPVGKNFYAQTLSYIPEGHRLRIYGSDITERQQAEVDLKTSMREVIDLRTALDEHAIVAITNPQGRITYVNDKFCAISKFSRGELLGQDHRIINSSHHAKEFFHQLWTTIGQGKIWRGEIKNRAKDGSFYWVDTTIVPFLDDQKKPRQYVAIRADITGLKQAEEEVRQLNTQLEQRVQQRTAELQAANKELEAFSYSVSHDLRAPLRTMDGFSQALLEDYREQLPENGQRYLHTIRQGAQRMGELVDDLLTFSRLSRLPLHRQTVHLTPLLQEVVAQAGLPLADRKIDLQIQNLPDCQGDPALLKQVWINLVSNAIKYTRLRDPAHITIGVRPEQDEVVYFIRDNGAGFDMQYASKLFGVFQRLHRAEDYEGTGVGLAIVQRIVHRHGGRIWADAALDQGATFSFTLQGTHPL
jgi:PAS domain S-box-containing protein